MAQPSSFVLTPKAPSHFWKLIDRKVSLGLAPISGFYVGAVGLGFSGRVFLGITVELPGLPLHHSIHAEQFLVANLELNSEPMLTHLAVSADDSVFEAPCGHCRQFLQEIYEARKIKILIKDPTEDIKYYVPLKRVLLHPVVLVPKQCRLLLDARDNELTLLLPDGDIRENPDLKSTALEAANKSYAPYSKCPSGMALKDRDEKVYRGWYMESAAYNPSLGPVQVALVDFLISGGTKFDNIIEAVLVEKKDAVVSQEKTARIILEQIAAPNCVFRVLHCLEPVKPEDKCEERFENLSLNKDNYIIRNSW